MSEARDEDPGPFLLAVQWHPEWRVTENPLSLAMFQAFGEACRARAAERRPEAVPRRARSSA